MATITKKYLGKKYTLSLIYIAKSNTNFRKIDNAAEDIY